MNNNILRKQFLSHVAQTSTSPMLVEVERAEGSFFYTPEGKRYYDLVAGVMWEQFQGDEGHQRDVHGL